MINKKKTGLCLALAATLIASSALCGCQQSDSSTSAKFNSDVKDASKYTADENAQVYKTLDFSDEQEKEFAKKGFITAPDKLEIKTENGTVAWSQTAYDFIRNSSTPDSANPSLWRNTELNSLYGLFEVVDGVYQVRGYDVANVTFVKSDNGWIVFDCTTSSETAKAALEQKYTLTGTVTSATAQLTDILEKLVAPSHHKIMKSFFDLMTVRDRLHGKLFISREYPSPQGIWRRATFIVQNRDNDDHVTELLYVTQIIDDYKQKELAYQQELVKAVESANQANTAKTEFLSRMSHDIRTPLNGILGMLDIAQKNETNPDILSECHNKMRTATFHLQALVNDVLDMQQMENDRFFLEQIPFDIREILDNCWNMLEVQASQLHITLERIKPGTIKYPYLIGSPLHIRQVFMNLLSNAIKYNKPGGKITIQSEIIKQVHQTVIYKFMISDTGIGMSPEFQKHIFEPFAQEDTGARTIYKGTGLGMAIVHRLIQEMGGTIQLKSEKNVGSTFTLILPFTIEEQQLSVSEETVSDTVADLSDLHVLIVEDNELNLEIAVFSLEAAGLKVSTAGNGLEAVRLFEKSEPYEYDIILMDIMMPVMNGLDATRAIRGLNRPDAADIPIIALSANAFAEDIQKSKNAGINEHLAKPLEMDKMLKVITSYCK